MVIKHILKVQVKNMICAFIGNIYMHVYCKLQVEWFLIYITLMPFVRTLYRVRVFARLYMIFDPSIRLCT